MYPLALTPRAEKELRGLSSETAGRIRQALQKLASDPYPAQARRLKGALKGSLRIRVGDHRVIYEIAGEDKVVLILKIGPRKQVYR